MLLTASNKWGAQQPRALGSTRVLQRLGVFIAASLFLHALTFGSYVPGSGGYQSPGGRASHTVLQAQLVHGHVPQPTGGPPREVPAHEPHLDVEQTWGQAAAVSKPATGDVSGTMPMPLPERWYEAAELDRRAQPLSPVELAYPAEFAGMSAAPATVRLRLLIDERGALRKLEVETSGPSPEFDEAAIRGWAAVRFSPAMKDGVTVKSQKLLEVAFAP